MTIIPFLHQLPLEREVIWIEAFRKVAPDLTLRPLRELSKEERETARFTVLGNASSDELMALPNLVWAQSLWAGVDGIVDTCAAQNIALTRLVDPDMARTLSEYVLMAALSLHRNLYAHMAQQLEADWTKHCAPLPKDRTIAVLGLGEIGTVTARRLAANGFRVLGWARSQKDIETVECLSGVEGLNTLLPQTDILVLLLPLTPQTEGLVDAEFLAKTKSGVSLINGARGALIEDEALLSALDNGQVSHVVLDVFRKEPLPTHHTYWRHPRVTVTPHVAATTRPETAVPIAVANIRGFLATGQSPDTVSPKRGY